MKKAVRAGNIVRTRWPLRDDEHLNLYMGSGRGGACFDAYGLMNRGFRGRLSDTLSATTIMHADHWHRGAWGLDYWLPIARLVWEHDVPAPPEHYRQELDLWEGRLTTSMAWPGLETCIVSAFHPGRRDLLAVEVTYQASGTGEMPSVLLAPELDIFTNYGQHLTGEAASVEFDPSHPLWTGWVTVGTADSALVLKVISSHGEARLEPSGDGVAVRFSGSSGKHLLLVGTAGWSRKDELLADVASVRSAEQYLAETAQAWEDRWGTGFIHVPVPEYQALWARSLFYVLSSCAPDVRAPAAPMGWSGNGWPFGFPQDLSYIHPALLRLGHTDIARAFVEFYRSRIDNMKDYTRRIYGAEGTMWAWEYPIGPDSRLLSEGTPNWCQFEIHNAAYPARMAREASLHIRDAQWTSEVAWPVVFESARFFASVLKPETDGKWGMHVIPSFGQDEMGGQDAKNYLCSLFSARYCLQTAVAMAREQRLSDSCFQKWEQILADGFAFNRLLDADTGILQTCEGLVGTQQIGKEKHPVQLNPLIFLPTGAPEDHVLRAYEQRYDLCAGVKDRIYFGWTLAAYWLAASHMSDADGLMDELASSLPGRYVDPDWIQIYETSGAKGSPFYVTSHGLYLQALTDAAVSDFQAGVSVGAAVPERWSHVRFGGLRVASGDVLSGQKLGKDWTVNRSQPSD